MGKIGKPERTEPLVVPGPIRTEPVREPSPRVTPPSPAPLEPEPQEVPA